MYVKKIFIITGMIFIGLVNLAISQETYVDRLTVTFSNPDKPGYIDIGLINGGIQVTGYSGKEVIVEAKIRGEKLQDEEDQDESEDEEVDEDAVDKDRQHPKDVKGMFRIPVMATGLSVEEENNKMQIKADSWKHSIDVKIQVPHSTSLKLNCINAGDILVENISGEIDANNINGKVTLNNISGTIVAHALNRNLKATLAKVNPEKPMSFSTMNGNIDVIFPENLKATVQLKSTNGEIYSDFPIELNQRAREVVVENQRQKGGAYRVNTDKTFHGTINGGGVEIVFKSFNGNIYIRNGK